MTIVLFPTRSLGWLAMILHIGRNNDLLKKYEESVVTYLQDVITTCWQKYAIYASLGVTQAQSIFYGELPKWFPRSTRADRGSRTVPDPNLRLHTAQQSLSNGQIIILSRLLSRTRVTDQQAGGILPASQNLKCQWTSWSWKLIAYIQLLVSNNKSIYITTNYPF